MTHPQTTTPRTRTSRTRTSDTGTSGTGTSGTGNHPRASAAQIPRAFPHPLRPAPTAGLPGLRDLESLRQVHALEHATVWLLSNHPELSTESARRHDLQDDGRLSGLSTHYGFYLYGPASTARIKWAAATALDRLKLGDRHLAVHPRCGTNAATQVLLTGGIALGVAGLLPKRPLEQLAGLGLSAALAQMLTPELGSWCQATLTTSIPHNLKLVQVIQTRDFLGRSAHFVRTAWVES